MSFISDLKKIDITGRGTIVVDPGTLETGAKGVFAAGDIISGPASIIEAIASGRQAATSIDKYLGGEGTIDEKLVAHEEENPPVGFQPVGERTPPPSLPVSERLHNLKEVEGKFDEETAIREAKRCLRCDLPIIVDLSKCAGCRTCQLRCSLRWEEAFVPAKSLVAIKRLVGEDHEYDISFSDKCDDCGICAKYCPYGALTRGNREET
jgi:ferredoxin